MFFWGHQPERDGGIGKGCLSQWWPCTFVVDGQPFASAEHYMMWRKALLFDDTSTASRVLAARTPAEAKALGRQVPGFSGDVWDASRFGIVVEANLAKFGQDPALRSYLLGTGSRVLVEASPQDRVWGIGLVASDPRAADPAQWLGLNLLGEALMEVRTRLSA
ncbi:hypothetical protein GCM10017774_86500 [Lentzea cavernae]|uniref:NADAR domain-containing protein n=1 Tax=Lentzea cavernae TaxID=2020703 RepID=A0ABQ3MWH1_9PSEU|nr:hypothetical protein GCM10017774_86500 [Lentzea cavernae]